MKLENQVVSLELSQKLRFLGIEKESKWYWLRDIEGNYHLGFKCEEENTWFCPKWNENTSSVIAQNIGMYGITIVEQISAFTVAELGELLLHFPYPATYETKFYEDSMVYFDIKFGITNNYRIIRTRSDIARKINNVSSG